MFNWKKEITQETIDPIIESPIELTEEAFLDYVIRFETGKLQGTEVLVFFGFIIQHEKWERYGYEWIKEMMDFGVLTDVGTVNPQRLIEYNRSRAKTKFA